MSVRLTQDGRCSWCGAESHGATGFCPHEFLKNERTTEAERKTLNRLCEFERDALIYGVKMRDMPLAVGEAAKLGVTL